VKETSWCVSFSYAEFLTLPMSILQQIISL